MDVHVNSWNIGTRPFLTPFSFPSIKCPKSWCHMQWSRSEGYTCIPYVLPFCEMLQNLQVRLQTLIRSFMIINAHHRFKMTKSTQHDEADNFASTGAKSSQTQLNARPIISIKITPPYHQGESAQLNARPIIWIKITLPDHQRVTAQLTVRPIISIKITLPGHQRVSVQLNVRPIISIKITLLDHQRESA